MDISGQRAVAFGITAFSQTAREFTSIWPVLWLLAIPSCAEELAT
jgi:hypothetical protein